MKKSLPVLIFVLILLFLVGIKLMGTYNSLVNAREAVDAQWSQVETQYQRRYDLIPNLVESVKGIMNQEQTVFNALAEARTRYGNADTVAEKAEAASEVETALGRLLVVVENYPELRSSDTVKTLMAQLEGTENRISVERQRYNELVRDYNIQIKRFPQNIIAGLFGFNEAEYFNANSDASTPPQVQF